MTNEKFEGIVEETLDSIPDQFWDELDNVLFAVADEPDDEQRGSAEDWNSVIEGDELLGLYEGTPLTERDSFYGTGELPDVITIFKGPHERCFGEGTDEADDNSDELIDQIRRTVIHEIGHYFGNDDATLAAMGY